MQYSKKKLIYFSINNSLFILYNWGAKLINSIFIKLFLEFFAFNMFFTREEYKYWFLKKIGYDKYIEINIVIKPENKFKLLGISPFSCKCFSYWLYNWIYIVEG